MGGTGRGVRSAWGKQLPLCDHSGPEESGQMLVKGCQEQSGSLMPLLPKEERQDGEPAGAGTAGLNIKGRLRALSPVGRVLLARNPICFYSYFKNNYYFFPAIKVNHALLWKI